MGFRASNTWPFKLELVPLLASNVVVISPGSPLTLVSTNADVFHFSYTNTSSGLTNGAILVSSDPDFPSRPGGCTLADSTTQRFTYLRHGVRYYWRVRWVDQSQPNTTPTVQGRYSDVFDFIYLPGGGHSEGGKYGERRRWDFFVEALLGVAPPDRNAPKPSLVAPPAISPAEPPANVAAQAQ